MERMEKLAEIRDHKGEVSWIIWVSWDQAEKILFMLNGQKTSQEESQNDPDSKENRQSNPDPMTQAQKRYLFRLLAERGIEKDEAYQKLKEAFGVETLKDVGKLEASREIERLLAKGGDK